MVAEILEANKDEIAALCRRYRVDYLDAFGSVTSDSFDVETSDVDFIVRFLRESSSVVYRFVGLADALERLLQRPVDLLTERSVGSPEFRRNVERSRVRVYERSHDLAAA